MMKNILLTLINILFLSCIQNQDYNYQIKKVTYSIVEDYNLNFDENVYEIKNIFISSDIIVYFKEKSSIIIESPSLNSLNYYSIDSSYYEYSNNDTVHVYDSYNSGVKFKLHKNKLKYYYAPAEINETQIIFLKLLILYNTNDNIESINEEEIKKLLDKYLIKDNSNDKEIII